MFTRFYKMVLKTVVMELTAAIACIACVIASPITLLVGIGTSIYATVSLKDESDDVIDDAIETVRTNYILDTFKISKTIFHWIYR